MPCDAQDDLALPEFPGNALRQLAPFAQSLEANGVDYFWTYDQLTFITPLSLWDA